MNPENLCHSPLSILLPTYTCPQCVKHILLVKCFHLIFVGHSVPFCWFPGYKAIDSCLATCSINHTSSHVPSFWLAKLLDFSGGCCVLCGFSVISLNLHFLFWECEFSSNDNPSALELRVGLEIEFWSRLQCNMYTLRGAGAELWVEFKVGPCNRCPWFLIQLLLGRPWMESWILKVYYGVQCCSTTALCLCRQYHIIPYGQWLR